MKLSVINRVRTFFLIALCSWGILERTAQATFTYYNVTVDTTPLAGYTGPFYLDLQLSGALNDGSTTATIDNFNYIGWTSIALSPFYTVGNVSWDGTTATLTDDPDFFPQLQLQLNPLSPGTSLSFDLTLDAPVSDPQSRFTAGIVYGVGTPGLLPNVTTADPFSSSFLTVDFGPTEGESARYDYQILSSVVPEPSTAFLFLTGLVVIFARQRAKAKALVLA